MSLLKVAKASRTIFEKVATQLLYSQSQPNIAARPKLTTAMSSNTTLNNPRETLTVSHLVSLAPASHRHVHTILHPVSCSVRKAQGLHLLVPLRLRGQLQQSDVIDVPLRRQRRG